MERTIDLSIIIVNWNSAAYLDACLRTIRENTAGLEYEIVVVDNASFDGSEEVARHHGKDIRFIQSRENLGFARANNLGVLHSTGKILLFLNPDTEIRGDALVQMYQALSGLSRAGCLGCRILNSNGTLQTSCIQAFPTIMNQILDMEPLRDWTKRSTLWGIAPLFDRSPVPVEVEAISGACLMIRRRVFEKVGAFSEDYFMFAEDMDLCLKVHRAGYRNYYFGEASIVHHGGGSTNKRGGNPFSAVLIRESLKLYMAKFHGKTYSILYLFSIQAASLLRLIALGIAYPLCVVRLMDRERLETSLGKWWSIFLWSIGLNRAQELCP